MNPVAKWFIVAGCVMIVIGFLWQFGGRFLHLGRLPGDILIEKNNFRFYFPVVTSIVLSVVFSLIMYLIRFFR